MRTRPPRRAAVLLALLALAAPGLSSGDAVARGRWAPADEATIHPGVQMYTDGAQCTANFVFTDRRGRVYVGYAAHCAGRGGQTDTNGCDTPSYPLGTRVTFGDGGNVLTEPTVVGHGRLAYSSWMTMQRIGTTRSAPCNYNDFALVRVDRGDVAKVNPSVPVWGGPTGVDRDGVVAGDTVYFYGNSGLLGGGGQVSPRTATVAGSMGGGWSHQVRSTVSGVPGDSGSGYLSPEGLAVGVLSTISLFPDTGSNNISDLAHVLAFARRHSGIEGLRLISGTEAFTD
ncbi:hypothetical protein [Nocardioides stalactiti]|uniref:hypothetical protein n=1 Tax=Nocardioides stalactiti TaxID=2755356 RepID=UPI00160372C2|nr:hypothetical protein [Nocardioides stalactiti]